MTPDTLFTLTARLQDAPFRHLEQALNASPEADQEAVLRVVARAETIASVQALGNPLRGLWSGAEERREGR